MNVADLLAAAAYRRPAAEALISGAERLNYADSDSPLRDR